MSEAINKVSIREKELWEINDLRAVGFSRQMAYQLLNREDVPTIQIGKRKFVHRELFQEWLRSQAMTQA